MEMTPQRWARTHEYAGEVFGSQDDHLHSLMDEATDAGLPSISVSADVGRLLMILASMTKGRLALEIGTLGGYSGIWIARGLAPEGKLITVEKDPLHAEFAEAQFLKAGVANRVEMLLGAGLDVLPKLVQNLGSESVDLVFIDAVKEEYPDYFRIVRPAVAPGGLVLADNVYGYGKGWIDKLDDPGIQALDEFNRMIATDPDYEAVAVPMHDGVLIARRNQAA